MKIEHIYISPGHNFVGHHNMPAGEHPAHEVPSVKCLAGRGLEGDRYLDHMDNYKGQITFFSAEVHEELCRRFDRPEVPPSAYRRNVIVRGADLNALIGAVFTVQGIQFQGVEECSPCYWMDRAFAPGACASMKGRGGLRARILSDGILSLSDRDAVAAGSAIRETI